MPRNQPPTHTIVSKYKRGKNKGQRGPNQKDGLGRLRRASAKPTTRLGNLSRHSDDDEFLEQHDGDRKNSHTGQSLLAKFNRLTEEGQALDGTPAAVCGFQGKFIVVRDAENAEHICEVRTALKKKLQGVRNPICIGDRVHFDRTPEGDPFINALLPRDNQLARADSHNKSLLHVFAANIDCLIIVTSILSPDIRPALIDRYLLIAHYNNIEPIIVINKCDLGDPSYYTDIYRTLDYPVFCTASTEDNDNDEREALRQYLIGKQCVVAGQSGVGKSSLINALFPGLDLRVGDISDTHNKGKHTTTAAQSFVLDKDTVLIDTPGIRECAVCEMTPLDVALLYRDIEQYHHDCKFSNCTHIHEPGCAVKEAVEDEEISVFRYESYVGIITDDLAD